MGIYSFSQNTLSCMLKMTFDKESGFQCTNTTNVSPRKLKQKIIYWKYVFHISSVFTNTDHNLLLREIYTHTHTHTKWYPFSWYIIENVISYFSETKKIYSLSVIYQQKILFSVPITPDFQKSHNFLLGGIHIVKNFKNIFFPSVKSDIWKCCYLLSRDYLHIRENFNVSFPLVCWLQG